jgi:hypothetical protein
MPAQTTHTSGVVQKACTFPSGIRAAYAKCFLLGLMSARGVLLSSLMARASWVLVISARTAFRSPWASCEYECTGARPEKPNKRSNCSDLYIAGAGIRPSSAVCLSSVHLGAWTLKPKLGIGTNMPRSWYIDGEVPQRPLVHWRPPSAAVY